MIAYAPVATKVYGDKHLEIKTRASLAESLLFSRLYFNCATWLRMTATSSVPVHKVVMRIARRISDNPVTLGDEQLSDLAVLKGLDWMLVEDKLRLERFRYAHRLILYAPSLLLALIQLTDTAKDSWMSMLVADFAFARTHIPKLSQMSDPLISIDPWFSLIRACTKTTWHTYTKLLANALLTFRHADRAVGVPPPPVPVYAGEQCDQCQFRASTQALLMSHKWHNHGYRQPARRYAFGTICRGCCTQFWTRARVVKHLAYASKHCLNAIMMVCLPMDDETLVTMNAEAATEARQLLRAGLGPTWSEKPPMKVSGPQLKCMIQEAPVLQ